MSKDDKWCRFCADIYVRTLQTIIRIFNIAVYGKIRANAEYGIFNVDMDMKLIYYDTQGMTNILLQKSYLNAVNQNWNFYFVLYGNIGTNVEYHVSHMS